MARTRKISADDILDAAERVILRLGAAGFSIDAVAQEAGVSKSRVVYDHKSKSSLLEALIERRLISEKERVADAVAANGDAAHPELFGRIALAEKAPDDIDQAVCLAISTAMASEDNIRKTMREWTHDDLKAIGSGSRPKAALIAYLALTGFCCTEFFDFYQWKPAERSAILDGIRAIYSVFPDET